MQCNETEVWRLQIKRGELPHNVEVVVALVGRKRASLRSAWPRRASSAFLCKFGQILFQSGPLLLNLLIRFRMTGSSRAAFEA